MHGQGLDHPVDTSQDVATQRECDMESSSRDLPVCTTSGATLSGRSVTSQNVLVASHLSSMCGSVVAHLQVSGLSESTVQTIVSSMGEVVNDVQSSKFKA